MPTADFPEPEFVANLAGIMHDRGLSMDDMAGLIGWSRSDLRGVLSGRAQVSFDDMDRVADALGVGVFEIRQQDHFVPAPLLPRDVRLAKALLHVQQSPQSGVGQQIARKCLSLIEMHHTPPFRA